MMGRAALAAAVVALACPGVATAKSSLKPCPSGSSHIIGLNAGGVTCAVARSVAKAVGASSAKALKVKGFSCSRLVDTGRHAKHPSRPWSCERFVGGHRQAVAWFYLPA